MPLACHAKIYSHRSVPVFKQLLHLLRILAWGVWLKHLRSCPFSLFTVTKGIIRLQGHIGHLPLFRSWRWFKQKWRLTRKELWLYLPRKYWPTTYKSSCGFCERQDHLTANTPPACTWNKIDMKRLCAVTGTWASVLSPSNNSNTFFSVYHLLRMTSVRSVFIVTCISSSAARYNPRKISSQSCGEVLSGQIHSS